MKKIVLLFSVMGLFAIVSCNNNKPAVADKNSIEISNDEILANQVLTADEQAKLTPDDVIAILKEGNTEFINDNLTVRNNTERIRQAALGQYPKAVVLSCLDSRVPVEDVFHRGIGDIFVARVAGNVVNPDIIGSMEFGCKVSGAKLILVLGHESCGAIKSAIDDVKLGNITGLLDRIQPAVKTSKASFSGEQSSKNAAFVEAVCEHNVALTVQEIRDKSPILKEMESKGEIKIVGAVYHMESGKVEFLL